MRLLKGFRLFFEGSLKMNMLRQHFPSGFPGEMLNKNVTGRKDTISVNRSPLGEWENMGQMIQWSRCSTI
jgi:hypothetical protein